MSATQLDDATHRAWRLLALFPAPFDAAAAAALWGMSVQPNEQEHRAWESLTMDAAREHLRTLCDRSLITFDPDTARYYQHDLLRCAAARVLEATLDSPPLLPGERSCTEREIDQARERLARHYLAVAQEVTASEHYPTLDHDWPHLQAALTYAAGQAEEDVGLLSDLAGSLASYWYARGPVREWVSWCRQAANACVMAGRRREEGAHLGNLGSAHAALGDALRASEYYEQALAISREVGDRRHEMVGLTSLGYDREALAIAREIGDHRSEAMILEKLGRLYHRMGEQRLAIEYYEQALGIYVGIEEPRAERVRHSLADLSRMEEAH